MTPDPLHPALVHIPLGLSMAIPLVAIALALALWKGLLPRRAWLAVVALQLMLVIGGVAAFRSGEGEERRVERVVGGHLIEEHEGRASVFLWAGGAVLVLALGAMLVPLRLAPAVAGLAAAGTLAVSGLAIRTGKAGGELVYRHGAAAAYTAAPRAEAERVQRGGARERSD